MTAERGNRRTKQGVVVSNKMTNTVVVRVERTMRHPKYEKVVATSRKYYAHDASGALEPGDKVTIIESRPISKLKRWRAVAKEA